MVSTIQITLWSRSYIVTDGLNNPVEVAVHFGIDAVLSLPAAALAVAGDAVQHEPLRAVDGGPTQQRASAVAGTRVRATTPEARTDLPRRDGVVEDLLTLPVSDDRHLSLHQDVGAVEVSVLELAPAHDVTRRVAGRLEVGGGQTGIAGGGEGGRRFLQLDEGDVVPDVVVVELRVRELLLGPDLLLSTLVFLEQISWRG